MFSRKLLSVVIPAFSVALFACGMARANLVTNGDFSLYASAPKNFFSIVQPTDWATTAYAFIDAPNTAEVDQSVLYIDCFPDTVQTDHIDWGFHVSGLYGTSYRFTTNLGYSSNETEIALGNNFCGRHQAE